MTGQVVVETPGDLASLIVQMHGEGLPDGRLFLAGFTKVGPQTGTVTGTAHMGMVDPPDPGHVTRETTKLVGQLAQWPGTGIAAIAAFGPETVADPYLDMAEGLVAYMAGLPLIDVVRVHDGRYWSYISPAPEYGRDSDGEEFELSNLAIEAATVIAVAVGLGGQDV